MCAAYIKAFPSIGLVWLQFEKLHPFVCQTCNDITYHDVTGDINKLWWQQLTFPTRYVLFIALELPLVWCLPQKSAHLVTRRTYFSAFKYSFTSQLFTIVEFCTICCLSCRFRLYNSLSVVLTYYRLNISNCITIEWLYYPTCYLCIVHFQVIA